MRRCSGLIFCVFVAFGMVAELSYAVPTNYSPGQDDWRNIANAISVIPAEGYCDQPYLVKNADGHWVCIMTTGVGGEGDVGQHIVATISSDQGKTWSPLIDVEPATGPEASWAVPYINPQGRIYAIYTYNADNMREVKKFDGSVEHRVDTLGKLMMKYSDDGGHHWSTDRYEVPMRNFEIDRQNVYGGKVQFFWSISKPIELDGRVFMGMGKVGNFGKGFMHNSEGCVLRSDTLQGADDAASIDWKTLPEGEIGIRAPEGMVADEHNLVALSDGTLFLTFRTVAGYAGQAYSRDGGRTWETKPAEYFPGGRIIKQPRCLIKVTRFNNGKFVMFFHNNGSRCYGGVVRANRNPTWISGGVERDGVIHWTEPEVFFYDNHYLNGISYPDWLEDDGRYFFSETQKTTARIHEVPADFLESLWAQHDRSVVADDAVITHREPKTNPGASATMPYLGLVSRNQGFSVEVDFETGDLETDQTLWTTRLPLDQVPEPTHGDRIQRHQGIEVRVLADGQVEVLLDEVAQKVLLPSGNSFIAPNSRHHMVLTLDADSRVVTLLIDGKLADGGDQYDYGFVRLSPFFSELNGASQVHFPDSFGGRVHLFRVYRRPLTTTEAVGNFRAARTASDE